jgi:prohibitin 2
MNLFGEAATVLQVSLLVRRELTERARDFNIILDDVSITELSFGKEYTAAVEAKQVGHCCACYTPL